MAILNRETYNRWRDLVRRYGGNAPAFDKEGSFDFFVAVCVAGPYNVKVVPFKTVKNAKRKLKK